MPNKVELFDQLFRDYKERLYRLCFSYCNDATFAEDLLQESFSRVWQNLDKFEHRASYGTWIYRIAVNTCLMHIRSAGRKPVVSKEVLPEAYEEEVCHEGRVNLLYRAIQQLNEADRLLVSMVLEDVPYKQIAEILGLTENNVGVKVHRVKGQLKTIMAKLNH